MAVVSTRAGRLGNRIAIAAVLVITLIFLAPIYWITSTAFKPLVLSTSVPPTVVFEPQVTPFVKLFIKRAQLTAPVAPEVYEAAPWWEKLVLDGGERLARDGKGEVVFSAYPDRFVNSLIISITSTILAVSMGTITAYGFSRFRVKGEADLLFFILSTRMLPPIVVAIPMFLMYRAVGLNDTHIGLIILYTAFNVSFAVWVMKGFIDEIPKEYEEAALVDGYTRMQAFFKIVLPEAATGIAATAVFCFIAAWNEYAFALILTNRRAQTAPPFIPSQIGTGPAGLDRDRRRHRAVPAAGRHLHLPAPQPPAARHELRCDPQMNQSRLQPEVSRAGVHDLHDRGHHLPLPAVGRGPAPVERAGHADRPHRLQRLGAHPAAGAEDRRGRHRCRSRSAPPCSEGARSWLRSNFATSTSTSARCTSSRTSTSR